MKKILLLLVTMALIQGCSQKNDERIYFVFTSANDNFARIPGAVYRDTLKGWNISRQEFKEYPVIFYLSLDSGKEIRFAHIKSNGKTLNGKGGLSEILHKTESGKYSSLKRLNKYNWDDIKKMAWPDWEKLRSEEIGDREIYIIDLKDVKDNKFIAYQIEDMTNVPPM